MRSTTDNRAKIPEAAGGANLELNNFDFGWDRKQWADGYRKLGAHVPKAARLDEAAAAVAARGAAAGPGERGWGVPERNIPNLTVGARPPQKPFSSDLCLSLPLPASLSARCAAAPGHAPGPRRFPGAVAPARCL